MTNIKPPDTRPYRAQSATGPELHINCADNEEAQTSFRQVGWHGQSGALYSLDEDPSLYERGSFSPLYIQIGD